MQFLTIVGSCKLNKDLNGFYFMQLGGVMNVITFLGINIVVKLGDGDAKQFHCCYFYIYTCCLLLCVFFNFSIIVRVVASFFGLVIDYLNHKFARPFVA